jgi:hypothetical protein
MYKESVRDKGTSQCRTLAGPAGKKVRIRQGPGSQYEKKEYRIVAKRE